MSYSVSPDNRVKSRLRLRARRTSADWLCEPADGSPREPSWPRQRGLTRESLPYLWGITKKSPGGWPGLLVFQMEPLLLLLALHIADIVDPDILSAPIAELKP